MLDFDAGKLLIIGVVALIVIGPKDLPRVLRQVGQAVGRVRRMATEFQGQFMDAMREADLEAIREDLKKATADAELDSHFDPARDIQRELTSSVDLAGATAASPGAEVPAVAASESSLPAATDGFALLPSASGHDEGSVTPADAGAVPVAPDADGVSAALPIPAPPEPIELPPAAEPPARKRRIRIARRPLQSRRVHPVLDRTGVARGTARTIAPGANP